MSPEYRIEKRDGTDVLLDGTGCRPITDAESQFAARIEQLEEALHDCAGEREMRDAALEDAYAFIRDEGQWDAFMEAINRPKGASLPPTPPSEGES